MPTAKEPATKTAARATKAADPNSPDNALYPVEGNPAACAPPLCPECFPAGWPLDATSVGCEHGMWIRQWPPAPEPAGKHERDEPEAGD